MSRRRELELDADLDENDIEDNPVLEDDAIPGVENEMPASNGGEIDIGDAVSTVSGTLAWPLLEAAAAADDGDNDLLAAAVFSHRALTTPPAKSDDRRGRRFC